MCRAIHSKDYKGERVIEHSDASTSAPDRNRSYLTNFLKKKWMICCLWRKFQRGKIIRKVENKNRKDNMYSVDLKNVVPQRGLTCPSIAKAHKMFESNLWHRRLGYEYSTITKPIQSINSRTRIVEENLHVKFSEDTLNIAGSGPNWLFDIDALTNSMNYKTVVAGNQSNGNAGTKACDDAGKTRMEIVPGKDYIGRRKKKDVEDPGNKDSKFSSTKEPRVNQEKHASVNTTDTINTNMPELEEIIYSDDDEDVGAEADINKLDIHIPVSPILTTRIHKDHPVEQIIGDIYSAPQTRRMTKSVTEQAMFRTRKMKEMDVKSSFLYEKIEEEVYVCQPLGFEDPDFPNRVYKVEKALYGLHQAPKAWLISWQRKKQTVVANFTTEVEYIAASNCCGHVLWIQNQLLDYGYNFMQTKIHIDNENTICIVKNHVFPSKTKHIEISHHFIRDSNEKKLIQMIKIHTD
ncbi:ribonuclease H-like domain-containing protein [Tanacetum coccineum]